MTKRHIFSLVTTIALSAAACGEDGSESADTREVIENYAAIAEAGYADAAAAAEAMSEAVSAFTADPGDTTFDAARSAWIAARVPYRETEGFRFYGGPIDDPSD